jgi:hypothetical protein
MKYIATGFVLGNCWGGGQGAYPSKKITSDTSLEDLLCQANTKL